MISIDQLSREGFSRWQDERMAAAVVKRQIAEAPAPEKKTPIIDLARYEREEPTLMDEWRKLKALAGATTEEKKLAAEEMGLSLASIYRRIERASSGPSGLMRKTHAAKGSHRAIDDETENFIIDAHLSKPHATAQKIQRLTHRYCLERDKELPSYTLVRRVIASVPGMVSARARRGVKYYRDHFEPIVRRERVDRLRRIFCLDHHELDLLAWNKLKQSGIFKTVMPGEDRPWITACMDLCNNEMTGWWLSWTPNAQTIALCLRRALLNSGKPEEIYIDNGKDYLSDRITAVCSDLNIVVHAAEQYHGQSKPIERFFRTFEDQLISDLPGYTANRPDRRPENARAELDLADLERLFHYWITREYHTTPSDALQGKSPNDVLMSWLGKGFVPMIPSERALDLLLMKSEERKVHRDGIHLFGQAYWNDLLVSLINDQDLSGRNRTVEVRFDPAYIGEVHIFLEGLFLCTAISEPLAAWGANEEDYKRVQHKRRTAKEFIRGYVDAIRTGHSTGHELIAETVMERMERAEASEPLELPRAVNQDRLHVLLPKYDSAARAIETGSGSSGRSTPLALAGQPTRGGTREGAQLDENGIEINESAGVMRSRYRRRNMLDRIPLQYVDRMIPLRMQFGEDAERLPEFIRNDPEYRME